MCLQSCHECADRVVTDVLTELCHECAYRVVMNVLRVVS